jgi:hypothetical protein
MDEPAALALEPKALVNDPEEFGLVMPDANFSKM